jgi:hypothetical protein
MKKIYCLIIVLSLLCAISVFAEDKPQLPAVNASGVPINPATDEGLNNIITELQTVTVVSAVNSTTTPLLGTASAPADTFTGTATILTSWASGTVSVLADQDSVTDGFKVQYSSDGTNWDHEHSYSVMANVSKTIPIDREGLYYRVVYTNGAAAQGTFRLQTLLSKNTSNPHTHPIEYVFDGTHPAPLTRTVISAKKPNAAYCNVEATSGCNLKLSLEESNGDVKRDGLNVREKSRTAFDEVLMAQLTPVVQLQFPYNINSVLVDSRANQSGAVTQASNMAHLSTGAAANSSAQLLSKDHIDYNPGQGTVERFTASGITCVANSTQVIGVGDSGDGYFFGCDGADFGVLRRKGGSPEIRTLTVSTASSDAENITITLDGDAQSSVTVTASGVITTTANEIAAADYTDTGRGWTAEAVGDTVIFYSWDSSVRTGSYTLSSATSAVGAIAQTVAGIAPTDTWNAQANWSEDQGDNSVLLPVMDWTKGNVFQIRYQWLGFGMISYSVENPDTGRFVKVHEIEYANANTSPSVNDPSLPLCAIVANASNATDLTMDIGSMAGFIEGKDAELGSKRAVKNNKTNAGATEIPILTIRNKTVYQGRLNRTKVKVKLASMSVEHTKPMTVNFYLNPTLTAASYSDVDTNTSVIQTDTSATSFSGGTLLYSIDLGKTGNQLIDLSDVLLPGNHVTATSIPNSSNGSETNVTFNFIELF